MELGLARLVARLREVEVAVDEAGVEVLHDVAEPALRQQHHLVGVGAVADLGGDPGDHGPPEDGHRLHEGLERDSLLGVAPGGFAGEHEVLRPRHCGVDPKGSKQRLQELGRAADGHLREALRLRHHQLRYGLPDHVGRGRAGVPQVGRQPIGQRAQEVTGPFGHLVAL